MVPEGQYILNSVVIARLNWAGQLIKAWIFLKTETYHSQGGADVKGYDEEANAMMELTMPKPIADEREEG